jgi:hypothetical protein
VYSRLCFHGLPEPCANIIRKSKGILKAALSGATTLLQRSPDAMDIVVIVQSLQEFARFGALLFS